MPVNTVQSKQVYLTVKPTGITTGGRPQPGTALKPGADEKMYAMERGNENYGMAYTLSSFEESGWVPGNGVGDSGVIANVRSKSVYINLKTPEKQDEGDAKSFQMAEDSSNGWNLLEALRNLSPLRGRKAKHDMWIEEETGQRAAFQNEVELDVTSASNLNDSPGNENTGGELRRNEIYISLGSPTTTPRKVHTNIVNEELFMPSINTVEELQSSSREEFMESSNSHTTVLVNYDLGSSSTEIAPPVKPGDELLEDVENDVALKDYIFYVQVKPQNIGEMDENAEITTGVQNMATLETGNYHDETDNIIVGDENLTDPQEGSQGGSEIMLSSSDSEGSPTLAASYDKDNDMALRSIQVSQLNVMLSSRQGDDKIEPGLYAGMSGDRYDTEIGTDSTTERDERQQEQYLSGKDTDGLRTSSWISLDNVHVAREDVGVLFSPYLDNEQLNGTVVERTVQPVKSKPLFVTLKPACISFEDRDTSVESEDGEKSLLPSFNEECKDAGEELRPFDGCALDDVVESSDSEYEETESSQIEQVEMVDQSGHEMEVVEEVDTDESKESADDREESEIERGQEQQKSGINITLKSQKGPIHEEVKMIDQPGLETEVAESKEFANGRKENEIERGQEQKQTGMLYVTLKSQERHGNEEENMVSQPVQEMEADEDVGTDEAKEFADDGKQDVIERGQEPKQTGMLYIKLKSQKGHIHEEGLLQWKPDDGQLNESKDKERTVDEKCEVEEVLNEDESDGVQPKDDESLSKEHDDSVKQFSDGHIKDYFGFPSRAEYLRSKIRKALQSNTQEYVIDQRSIVYENIQEKQVSASKSERVKELLKRLGRDGESVDEAEISRQMSDDLLEDCISTHEDIDYARLQTSSISLTLQPVVDHQSEDMVVSSFRDGDVREIASDQPTDDQGDELLQHSQCLDFSNGTGVEDHNDTGVEEGLESTLCEEVCSVLMMESGGNQNSDDTLVPKSGNSNKELNLKRDQENVKSETVYICLKTSDVRDEQMESDESLSGWQKFLGKVNDTKKATTVKEQMCAQEKLLVNLQAIDDQQSEMVSCSPCLDSKNESRVEEVLESVSHEEVESVFVTESEGNQNEDVSLVPERDDEQQNWKGGGGNVKSETVYIRLKTADERVNQLVLEDLLSGNQAGSNQTDVDEIFLKDNTNDSKSPSKRKLLDFGIKKKLEEFGEHAVGVVGDIAQSGRDLAVSVVKKGKSTPVHPDLREVVLSRLRSREGNGDRTGKTRTENGMPGKVRSVRSLFTPEEHLILANAADHVDAARMMEMMMNLVPDLASRVSEAEFEDETRGQVMKMVDALKEWKPTLSRRGTETDGGDNERQRLSETVESCKQKCVDESIEAVSKDDITKSRIVEALMRLKLSKDKEVETEEDALERSWLLDVAEKMSKQCKDKGAEMHGVSLKMKEALMEFKPNIGKGEEHSVDDTEALGILEAMKGLSLEGHVKERGAEVDDEWRIKEVLMKLKPHFPDRGGDTDAEDDDRTGILNVLRKLKPEWPKDSDSEDGGSSGIQEALHQLRKILADDETDGKALKEKDRFKLRDIMKNLTPDLDLGAWDKTMNEETSKVKDVLMSLKPDFSLREIGSVKGDLEKSQLSKTLQKLVPDWSFGRNEDSQEGDGDFELAKVMEMLKKLKPNLDAANVSDDAEISIMESLKRLKITPRLQDLKANVGPSSQAREALGTLRSVLAEGEEKVNLTVGEFSRISDALGSMMPQWNREHGDEDMQEESFIAIKEALLSLKPNLDGENSKIKDLFMKLAAGKGNGSGDSHEEECQEEKVGMLQALREMVAPRRPADELKIQEIEEEPPEDGVNAMVYQTEKDSESREKEWKKVGKLLRNLITFGTADGERNGVVAFVSDDEGERLLMPEKVTDFTESKVKEAMMKLKALDGDDRESKMSSLKKSGWLKAVTDFMAFWSDDEGERLLMPEKATDFTESKVKEAMMKLKALDGDDGESKMSSLKKSRWLKAVIDFMVLGNDIKYQSMPLDKVITVSKVSDVETIPGTSKDEDAIVHENSMEALPSTSPIDHFKAKEALQSLNETGKGGNQGTSNQWRPWKIFATSKITKQKTDRGDSDDMAGRDRDGESSRSDDGLQKGIDIIGLAHPYISKRRCSSSRGKKMEDENGQTTHRVTAKQKWNDDNIYMTFKMTHLSGFSPVSRSNRNVIVHDVEVLQGCICISIPLTSAIRNFVMSDADIARKSTDGDGFLIISGDGDASLDVEVQEDITSVKVGDQEKKSDREEVNMDDLADILNGNEAEPENEEEPEPEGEVVTEEQIAEVKVGGVEAGISIQWPGEEEEEEEQQTEETAVTADTDEKEKVEETEEVEESEKIEEVEETVENIEVVENDEEETNEVTQKQEELLIDVEVTQKQEELLIDVQVNGEVTEEVTDEAKEEVNDEVKEEVNDEVKEEVNDEAKEEVNDEVKEEEFNVEVKLRQEEVVEDDKQEDESSAGNVAIEITLGEEVEEEKKEEKEEVTEKVSHVRQGRVAKNLSDRIRAFESKNKENEPVVSQSKRSTSKLDNTKIIKYQGSVDEQDGEPVKQVKGAGRLDMSRFSLFQKKSEGSEPAPKKNFTIKPVTNKNRFGSPEEEEEDAEPQGPSSTDASNKCLICEKRVYPMEKLTADGKSYHKTCFKCTECKKVLNLGTFAQINTLIFCKPHFKQRFKLHGNYDTGFSKGASLKSPNTTADGFSEFSTDKSVASSEIAATQAQTTESTPVVREDLVRSSDTLDDKRSVEGGTKSILERFKQGPVSNVEIKRTIDEENVSVRSLENYEPPPPEEEEEDTRIKPQDMIDTDRDEGQSAESQPQEAREDIVRSNQDVEEVRSSVGLKNLKSMFEKGGVSNVEVKVQKEKIEVKSLGEVEESESKAVAENVPQSQKPDVVSGGAQEEDPGIKMGLAQKIRAQFEKGNVSNIEEKPRPDLERTPKSLDDFADEQSAHAAQSVSESTPQRRDDVIRSDVPLEEQSHLAEGTRSLLSKWEKGEVEHAEEKPKENLSEPKDFKDVIQFSESTPEVRDDLVRETDQLDESIPEGVTKNLAGNLEGGAEFSVEVGIREEVEDEESTAKRLSGGDDNPEILVSVEINGNVSPGENGHSDGLETTPNGHYENDVESPEADPSLEIKAARAAALEDQDDEGDATMLVDSR